MNHVPELPTQYVSEECNSIYAGIVSADTRGNHSYARDGYNQGNAQCSEFVRIHSLTDGDQEQHSYFHSYS